MTLITVTSMSAGPLAKDDFSKPNFSKPPVSSRTGFRSRSKRKIDLLVPWEYRYRMPRTGHCESKNQPGCSWAEAFKIARNRAQGDAANPGVTEACRQAGYGADSAEDSSPENGQSELVAGQTGDTGDTAEHVHDGHARVVGKGNKAIDGTHDRSVLDQALLGVVARPVCAAPIDNEDHVLPHDPMGEVEAESRAERQLEGTEFLAGSAEPCVSSDSSALENQDATGGMRDFSLPLPGGPCEGVTSKYSASAVLENLPSARDAGQSSRGEDQTVTVEKETSFARSALSLVENSNLHLEDSSQEMARADEAPSAAYDAECQAERKGAGGTSSLHEKGTQSAEGAGVDLAALEHRVLQQSPVQRNQVKGSGAATVFGAPDDEPAQPVEVKWSGEILDNALDIEQVARSMKRAYDGGVERIRLRVGSADNSDVTINVVVNKSGITAKFAAVDEGVLDLLRTNIAALKEGLAGKGLVLLGASFTLDTESGEGKTLWHGFGDDEKGDLAGINIVASDAGVPDGLTSLAQTGDHVFEPTSSSAWRKVTQCDAVNYLV